MRKSQIESGMIYAVNGADRVVVPSLVISSTLWDRAFENGRATFQPSPPGARWAASIDWDAGSRRGILVVLPRPGRRRAPDEVIPELEALAKSTPVLDVPHYESVVAELQAKVLAPFVLDVIRDSRIIMPWGDYVTGEGLHPCPGENCSARVALNATDKLRAHANDSGAPCIRSNTLLTEEERTSE
ncbi:hypothetical protein ACH4S8_37875 [Streptomyces sp. NPDC021080]|uniref:hypothetical protein n=1 Tax=Streptomyces sp. NPDC021080 TaxID=3365110 RepID=UPI00379AC2F9